MSIAWTPIRLTMSASSQSSNLNEHVNAIRSNKMTHTAACHNNYCGEDYPRQQETVFEKQTVRITPPSQIDGPKSTVIIEKRRANGYGNVVSSVDQRRSRSSSQLASSLQSASDGHYFVNSFESRSRLLVDKECQTDDFLDVRRATSSKLRNMDDSGSAYDFTLNTNEQIPDSRDDVDNFVKISNEPFHDRVRDAERIESKDRETEHVDVIVNELRCSPETADDAILPIDPAVVDEITVEKHEEDELQVISEDVTPNGFLPESEIEVQKSDNSKLKDDKNSTDDDRDDSCCVDCLYVTLNFCDCVIL